MKREQLSIIFENFKDGFVFCDEEGKIIYVNPSYCRLCDVEKEALIGRDYRDLLRSSEKVPLGLSALKHVYLYMERIEIVDGKEEPQRRCNVTAMPLFDGNGALLYAVVATQSLDNVRGLFEDLTAEGAENVRATIKPRNAVLVEDGSTPIIAESDNMKEAVAIALQVAPTDASVLIMGASGSGKEVIAELIYQNSKRKGKPFIKINCAAIPPSLMESELFGYATGAFTGALKGGKPGLFEVANGGVVFLDEIGDMPLELQSKILRLIQSREVMRVGGRVPISLDIRLIAATNVNLKEAVAAKRFREDLYYRINVVPINLLPLEERKEDIEPLLHHFLEEYNKKYEKSLRCSKEASFLFVRYNWPGNTRELRNIVERLVVMSRGEFLDVELLRKFLGMESGAVIEEERTESLFSAVENLEKSMIQSALQRTTSKRKAAAELGIDHSTLIKKCRKYGI